MSYSSVEAVRETCDVLDTLLVVAKHDRAPMRAISLLERARSQMQAHLDQIDPAGAAAELRP